MLDAIVPFILIGILVIGWRMDKLGIKFKSESPEARAKLREEVQVVRDRRYQRSLESEARAIISREVRAAELAAALEAERARLASP